MELEELKAIMAASLLGGSVKYNSNGYNIDFPDKCLISMAVKTSQKLWEEVLRQERED